MKDPKFRVWDVRNKTMYYIGQPPDYKWVIEFGAGEWEVYEMQKSEPAVIIGRPHTLFSVLMLSTGLKDKNNKDIFEGDKVKLDDEEDIGIVTWLDAAFYIENGSNYWQLDEFDELEIVGNIYEAEI